MSCSTCGADTPNTYRLCDPCRIAGTKAECEASGVPFDLRPEQLARVEVLSRPGLARSAA